MYKVTSHKSSQWYFMQHALVNVYCKIINASKQLKLKITIFSYDVKMLQVKNPAFKILL